MSDSELPRISGAPSSVSPSFKEPTKPQTPPEPKPDQAAPKPVTATGCPMHADAAAMGQQGEYLTTAQGARVNNTDHSLKAGQRGPTLLQDHHLREKITHFDHERIPERAVHARGVGAHGVFKANGAAAKISKAGVFADGKETDVFVRFSTVLGSRGSSDTVRDTRGFAVKFYTDEGTWDLVGNNIPIFFIQDAIKFPDLIHAGKPHPDREIPQAQSAHDTFWDFISLHTEATAHTLWNMSDRAIPRSLRMMEGFGIHTFRFVNEEGETSLVKFHWKPKLGVHSMVWEEAQLTNGMDPDFHRRDLADAIEAGAFPQWDLGVQVFPDNEEQTFEGIDLLDPTKFVPEELAPVQIIGTMTLNANPTNYFAETEQVAFHPGHLVPGIDFTADPLLQGRLFSYLDTQLSRLGGPNFSQLPINRPHTQVNDNFRDGMHQTAVHGGVAPYHPNSLDAGCPFIAGAKDGALIDVPVPLEAGTQSREKPASFDDHTSQAGLFFRSLTPVEQDHVVSAYVFELSKCFESVIRERVVGNLNKVDADLAKRVADGLGIEVPTKSTVPDVEAAATIEKTEAVAQIGKEWPIESRQIGILATPKTTGIKDLVKEIDKQGMVPLVISTVGGKVDGVDVSRTYAATRSIEFDALIAVDVPELQEVDLLLSEAFRHKKAIAIVGGAVDAQAKNIAGVGVEEVADAGAAVDALVPLLKKHRVWERE